MSDESCGLWRAFGHEAYEGHAVVKDEALLVKQLCGFCVNSLAGRKEIGIEGLDFITGLGGSVVIIMGPVIVVAVYAIAPTVIAVSGEIDCLDSIAASHRVSVSPVAGDKVEGWTALFVHLIGYKTLMVDLVAELSWKAHKRKDFVFGPWLARPEHLDSLSLTLIFIFQAGGASITYL